MIKRALFAALVFAAPVCLVLAQDTRISVDMIGIEKWRTHSFEQLRKLFLALDQGPP